MVMGDVREGWRGRRGGRNKKPGAEGPAGRRSRVSISTITLIWARQSSSIRARASSKAALLLSPAACHNAPMPRIDRYDIIGLALLAFVVALWVLHFSLPTPPPDNYRNFIP
jgi:hypothetical protein